MRLSVFRNNQAGHRKAVGFQTAFCFYKSWEFMRTITPQKARRTYLRRLLRNTFNRMRTITPPLGG